MRRWVEDLEKDEEMEYEEVHLTSMVTKADARAVRGRDEKLSTALARSLRDHRPCRLDLRHSACCVEQQQRLERNTEHMGRLFKSNTNVARDHASFGGPSRIYSEENPEGEAIPPEKIREIHTKKAHVRELLEWYWIHKGKGTLDSLEKCKTIADCLERKYRKFMIEFDSHYQFLKKPLQEAIDVAIRDTKKTVAKQKN